MLLFDRMAILMDQWDRWSTTRTMRDRQHRSDNRIRIVVSLYWHYITMIMKCINKPNGNCEWKKSLSRLLTYIWFLLLSTCVTSILLEGTYWSYQFSSANRRSQILFVIKQPFALFTGRHGRTTQKLPENLWRVHEIQRNAAVGINKQIRCKYNVRNPNSRSWCIQIYNIDSSD